MNKRNVKHAEKIVSISHQVKNRVKKYLKKESKVIHPPIETSKFYYKKHKNYWLSVNRLITHKNVDMQIKAFQKLKNEKLIIIGSYEQSRHFKKYANYIKRIKPRNVEILSWVDQKKLIDLYANCKGFITTSKDEDFGMSAVEAMASGKPVIAPNQGGYKETLIHNKTGALINNINAEKLVDNIKKIGKHPETYKKACIQQAKRFDTKIFIKKIKKEIEK